MIPKVTPTEKLIKNKIANCLHYYRHTKEPDLEKEVDNIYCLMKSLTPSDLENLK